MEIFDNFIKVENNKYSWKTYSWKDYATNKQYSVGKFYTTDGLHFTNTGTNQRTLDAYMHSMFDRVNDL